MVIKSLADYIFFPLIINQEMVNILTSSLWSIKQVIKHLRKMNKQVFIKMSKKKSRERKGTHSGFKILAYQVPSIENSRKLHRWENCFSQGNFQNKVLTSRGKNGLLKFSLPGDAVTSPWPWVNRNRKRILKRNYLLQKKKKNNNSKQIVSAFFLERWRNCLSNRILAFCTYKPEVCIPEVSNILKRLHVKRYDKFRFIFYFEIFFLSTGYP